MELIQNKDGNINARRNGKDLICPFMHPTMSMSITGQPQIIFPVCGSHCAKFEHRKSTDNEYNVVLSCGTEQRFTNVQLQQQSSLEIKKV